MFSLETFLSVLLTSMFMTFPSSVFTLVLFDSLWKLQVEFIKCVLLWLHGDPSLPRILAGGLLSCVCLKINLKHIFVSVFNVQTHKHVVQTQPRKQLLSKQMKFYNLHFTVCEISKFLTLFANTIKSCFLFCLFLSFYLWFCVP